MQRWSMHEQGQGCESFAIPKYRVSKAAAGRCCSAKKVAATNKKHVNMQTLIVTRAHVGMTGTQQLMGSCTRLEIVNAGMGRSKIATLPGSALAFQS